MGTRRTIRLAVVAAAVGALALPAVTHAAPVTDAFHKPLEDGCQRNIPGLLTYSSPEWVWVNSAQAQNEDNTRQLEGLVRDPHTAGQRPHCPAHPQRRLPDPGRDRERAAGHARGEEHPRRADRAAPAGGARGAPRRPLPGGGP